jgi:predicted transcriptional regulator
MRTVTLEIAERSAVNKRLLGAFSGKQQGEFISFATPELLFKSLSGKRWELLQAMTGAGAISIREAARRVHRDVKAVHGDVKLLLEAGLIEKNESGQIVFPYDAIHVDFMLKEAA